MKNEISKRQSKILSAIVEEHIKTGEPVGSKFLMQKYFSDLSSATVRNEMSSLEEMNLLEKAHISSGRLPTEGGFKYYHENLLKPFVNHKLKTQLYNILHNRNIAIDTVLNESIKIIQNVIKLPSVVTIYDETELLKKIDLVMFNRNNAIILLVTSSGNVIKHQISYGSERILRDISVCVRIFNDRLIDTPLTRINNKINQLIPLIKTKVVEYEYVIQEVILKIFQNDENFVQSNIYGKKDLACCAEFNTEKLATILDLLENKSIWTYLSKVTNKNGKTNFILGKNLGINGITIASIPVKIPHNSRQIAVVGPNRMNYNSIKGILDFFKEEIEKIWNKE